MKYTTLAYIHGLLQERGDSLSLKLHRAADERKEMRQKADDTTDAEMLRVLEINIDTATEYIRDIRERLVEAQTALNDFESHDFR